MKIRKSLATVAAVGILSACVESTGGSSAVVSSGGVPAFSASCPHSIEANSDGSGQVYINAQAATVTKFSDSFYEAVLGDVTVSTSQDASGAVSTTYNKKGVGNGVCTIN